MGIIDGAVRAQLDKLGVTVHEQMRMTSDKIIREFDRLTDPLFETLRLLPQAVDNAVREPEAHAQASAEAVAMVVIEPDT